MLLALCNKTLALGPQHVENIHMIMTRRPPKEALKDVRKPKKPLKKPRKPSKKPRAPLNEAKEACKEALTESKKATLS